MNEIVITKENFDEEVRNYRGLPILLDFWAGWCGPCMMLAPIVEEIAEEYDGKVRVGKVNVDEESELASKYNVMSIPMIAVFKDGQISKKSVGAKPADEIKALLS